ncbi:MAG: PilN domain-containing protein [Gemmatimonadaceae bacterium]
MIEINLLPGGKKPKRGGGGSSMPSINFAAWGAAISARVKDKWLATAVGTGIVVVAFLGYLFTTQRAQQRSLQGRETKAVSDSTEFATYLRDRMQAQSRRDSALVQLSIIKAIDEDRLIWPHVMEEVSKTLPIYTWLRTMAIYGTPQGLSPAAAIKTPPPDSSPPTKIRKRRPEPVIPRDTIRVRIVGRTVDLQALTRFMRSLEDSPFIEAVTLFGSQPMIETGKDAWQFTLDVTYARPDTLLVNRVPLNLSPR